MGVPTLGSFVRWVGNKLSNTSWNDNIQTLVDIFGDGTYDLNINQITASNYVGLPSDQFTTVTAGENLDAGDVVRLSGGQAFKADNSTSTGIQSVVGVANATTSSGQTVSIDYGFYNSFSGLTAGTVYYIGTSGGITSTKPTLYPLEVGRAVSTTRINFSFVEDDKPTGTIISTSLTSVPKGYLECNGSNVSRTTHARLFAEIGVIYGNGDGSSTFTLPDYRGRFLRGFDNSAGTDPDASSRTDRGDGTSGDAVGTKQADAFQGHYHHKPASPNTYSEGTGAGLFRTTASGASSDTGVISAAGALTDGTNGSPRITSETRPTNINVMYCIKL